MAVRQPLVLAADGLIQQLQAGDSLLLAGGVAKILEQNNAIIRILANILANEEPSKILSTSDLNEFLKELI